MNARYSVCCFGLLLASSVFAQAEPPSALRIETRGEARITSVVFSGNSRTLAAAASDQRVKLFELNNGKQIGSCADVSGVIALSPDGQLLAYATGDPEKPGTLAVKIWSIAEGKLRTSLGNLPGRVLSLSYAPNGKSLAVGLSWDVEKRDIHCLVKLFSTDDGRELGQFGERVCAASIPGVIAMYGTALVFTPDCKTLVVGGNVGGDVTGDIVVWDVATRQQIGAGKAPNVCAPDMLAVSADGKSVAASGYQACVWEIPSAKIAWSRQREALGVTAIAFSNDGKSVLETSSGGMLQFEAASGKVLSSASRSLGVSALSPDGQRLANVEGNAILLFTTASLLDAKGRKPN